MSDDVRIPLLSPGRVRGAGLKAAECILHESCFLSNGNKQGSAFQRSVRNKLLVSLILSCIFLVVEVVGGYYARSVAIMSDAAHMLSDVAGYAVALFASWAVTWRSHHSYSFGYHRAEIIGALFSTLIIWAVTGALVWEAVQRVITPEPVNGKLMFILASAGVVFNIVVGLVLGHTHAHGVGGHSHGHSQCGHSHGHDHEHTHTRNHVDGEHGAGHGHGKSCDHDHDHDHDHGHGHADQADASRQAAQQAAPPGGTAVTAEAGSCNHAHDHDHDHDHDHKHDHGHAPTQPATPPVSVAVVVVSETGPSRHGSSNGSHGGHVHEHGHGDGHGHDHDHDHDHDHENMNLRGAILHVIGDLLQSVGVAIAGLLIWLHEDDPRWVIADPLCTFFFAGLVLLTTKSIIQDIIHVLMERTPVQHDIHEMMQAMGQIEGVRDVHDLHVWNLSMGLPILTAHVYADPNARSDQVLQRLEQFARKRGIKHSTVQICTAPEHGL